MVTEFSSEYNIRRRIKESDLIVGGVLIKGAKAPKLITNDMLKEMRPGTVIVDVAVDQGGCFETTKTHYPRRPNISLLMMWCIIVWLICPGRYLTHQLWH